MLDMTKEKTAEGTQPLKWVWLLYLASNLPLAMLFLTRDESRVGLISMSRIGVFALAAGFLVFWITTQSLLGMFRYPLAPLLSARVLASQVIQAALVLWASRSWPFVFLTLFMTILTALTLVVLALSGWKLLSRPIRWFRVLVYATFVALCVLFCQIFLGPLIIGLKGMGAMRLVAIIAVIALNSVNTALVLYHFPLPAKPVRLGADYDREWQRWAPRTFILLIASAIAAAVLAAVGGIR
jgi:hypothetical protein